VNKIIVFGFVLMLFSACIPQQKKNVSLKPLEVVKLNISEPSGISYFNNHLYIVSDQNGIVYKTSLDGEIQQKIKTKYSDLEGITIDTNSKEIWLVSEGKRKLIAIDSLGRKVKSFIIKGKQKRENSGLEGVCYDKIDSVLYVVNEKSPKQLLKLNLTGEITSTIDLKFADDISGISKDDKFNNLWIVSDESNSIYNIDKKGELLKKYKISVPKAEGIVVINNRIYIVSDSSKKLYIYEKPI